jgi:hypothetical protein
MRHAFLDGARSTDRPFYIDRFRRGFCGSTGDRFNVVLKLAEGCVKCHGKCTLSADEIRPLEIYPVAMTFRGYLERIGRESYHVIAPIDSEGPL